MIPQGRYSGYVLQTIIVICIDNTFYMTEVHQLLFTVVILLFWYMLLEHVRYLNKLPMWLELIP